jgi:deazaflavin-dependent oxidoreductase (nitroreductase family)
VTVGFDRGMSHATGSQESLPQHPMHGSPYAPSPSKWVADQVETYERSGGIEATTIGDNGLPVVIMTMVGHHTGLTRKVPVMRVEHDGVYAAVASLGGAPENPLWYSNLTVNRNVELRDGATVREMVAREITGDEKALWWQRCVEAYPPYAEYQQKTDRQIPVFLLEPV